jgi:O-palmitoleoyl transferase
MLSNVHSLIILLLFSELIESDAKLWHQIRGIQMIAVMKTMSLAFDLEAGKIGDGHKDDDVLVDHKITCPNTLKYFGYMLCPANCILGPWCSYQEYLEVFRKQLFTGKYFGKIAANSLVSAVFLVLSNCVISFLISDNSWKWLLAYRDALSFRCSHYFVSFLSQATMVTAGFADKQQTAALNREQGGWFGYDVVRPELVEFPRSLVQVVIGWNIPMHYWLKHCEFQEVLKKA